MKKHPRISPTNPMTAESKVRSQKPPIDLEALTPTERRRLDVAVMALVDYLVANSARSI